MICIPPTWSTLYSEQTQDIRQRVPARQNVTTGRLGVRPGDGEDIADIMHQMLAQSELKSGYI